MRNSVIILCILCAPIISAAAPYPQYSVEAQIVGSQQQFGPPQPQAYPDSPNANIVSFDPERTHARLSGRSQSHYNAAPEVPDQYAASPVPQPVPKQLYPYGIAPQQPQPQPQPQLHYREQPQPRQPYTVPPPPAAEETSPHSHTTTPPIQILKWDKSQSLDGSYKQSWESANNIAVEESGYWKDLEGKNEKALVQQGAYSYTAPDGTVISTSYTADEGGFKVEGSHLPTPPPIPEEIQKGLNQIYDGIRQQQELEAKEIKEGKIRPTIYDDQTGLPIEEPNQAQLAAAQRRQYNNYQQQPSPQVAQPQYRQVPQPQYRPVPQPQYQPVPEQSQLYQRQQYQ